MPGLTLGTAVLLPALRNPVVLAHQVATLDQLAEGRLILGVGFAADRPNIRAEFAAAGVPFEHRIGRMIEGLRLCRALWSGHPVDWDGRWQMTGAVVAPTSRAPGRAAAVDRRQPAGQPGARREVLRRMVSDRPGAAGFAAGMARCGKSPPAGAATRPRSVGAMYLTVSLDDDRGRGRPPDEPVPGTLLRSAGREDAAPPGLLRRAARKGWRNGLAAMRKPARTPCIALRRGPSSASGHGREAASHVASGCSGPVSAVWTANAKSKRSLSTKPAHARINFDDRIGAAAAAKKAVLERFLARPKPDDPATLEQQAALKASLTRGTPAPPSGRP